MKNLKVASLKTLENTGLTFQQILDHCATREEKINRVMEDTLADFSLFFSENPREAAERRVDGN